MCWIIASFVCIVSLVIINIIANRRGATSGMWMSLCCLFTWDTDASVSYHSNRRGATPGMWMSLCCQAFLHETRMHQLVTTIITVGHTVLPFYLGCTQPIKDLITLRHNIPHHRPYLYKAQVGCSKAKHLTTITAATSDKLMKNSPLQIITLH